MTDFLQKIGLLRKPRIDKDKINKEAAAILHSACQAVQAILDRRAALDREGQHNKPLVVLAGEAHSMPAHYVHHMLVLKGLVESGEKIVFGVEQEHNLLSEQFFKLTGRRPDSDTARHLRDRDQDGTLTLQCYSGFVGALYANHSRNILFRFLRSCSEIAVRFNDTVKLEEYLHPGDLSTAQSMQSCLGTVSAIRTQSPKGIRVRNHHMATMTKDFAAVQNARIVVQHCGNAHVAGNEDKLRDHPARYSLSACFKAQDIPVLAMPIFFRGFDESNIPADHGLQDDEQLYRRGLPEKHAIYHPFEDIPLGVSVDFKNRAAEAAWVNALLERVGLESECMSVEEYREQKEVLQSGMIEQFRKWDKEFFPPSRDGVNDNNNSPVLQVAAGPGGILI